MLRCLKLLLTNMYKFFVMLFLILILLNTCAGCTYMIAKETVKVIDMALDDSPNPEKKKKILEKKKIKNKETYLRRDYQPCVFLESLTREKTLQLISIVV